MSISKGFNPMNHRRVPVLVGFAAAAIVFFAGCSKKTTTNPYESTPDVTITLESVNTQDTVYADSARFGLSGSTDRSQFRYKLDDGQYVAGAFAYMDEIVLRYLDEGEHTLTVETRNEGWTKTSIANYTFVVNAIDTSAVYVYPRKASIVSPDSGSWITVKYNNLKKLSHAAFSLTNCKVDTVAKLRSNDSLATLLYASGTVDFFFHPPSCAQSDTGSLFKMHLVPIDTSESVSYAITDVFCEDSSGTRLLPAILRGGILVK